MNIVLHQPEIPANTGNIGRTCVATGSTLHLIEPLGFRLTGKELKRAGMDYWEHLDVRRYMNFEEFLEKNPGAKIWMATTKAKKVYTEAQFGPDEDVYKRQVQGFLTYTVGTALLVPKIPFSLFLHFIRAFGGI